MKRGTALVMLARASEDLLVAQQALERMQQAITEYEEDETVHDLYVVYIRDRAAEMRITAEGAMS